MRIRTLLRLATPLLAFAFVLGCADAGPNSGTGPLPTLTDPGFYPLLSEAPGATGESVVTLSLKQVPGGIELASVQGEITYDAASLQLARAVLPAGVEGDAFEVAPGRVRFVGTMMDGVTEPPLLDLVFTGRKGALKREMFTVRFEEVTGGAEFDDLTATVRSDRLLFQSR
ncbi:hypothetical protein [Longimicrobium sp.]|uniref:hypothetical protein n=1 Tax=Longimicrobium sp. TaxID=2029185 RepID=UPI003B3B1F85